LKASDVASTERIARAYQDVLFTTAGVGEFISGVILFDETIRQKTRDSRALRRSAGATGDHSRHQGGQRRQGDGKFPGEKITGV
jgi:hypothetical protein